jgi:prepilin-type processing-associated H-X9-DG protein
VNNGYRWNNTLGAEFAVAADLNPGNYSGYNVGVVDENSAPSFMQKANSSNHQGAGENVLYGDGHVEFQQNPFCGTKRDNVYTKAGGSVAIPTTTAKTSPDTPGNCLPLWAGDSILIPTAAGIGSGKLTGEP